MHIDAADGGIAGSCLLTSASLHDSQAAIPLATMTGARVTHLYDLMDQPMTRPKSEPTARPGARCNHSFIKRELLRTAKAQRSLGHVSCEQVRYRERSTFRYGRSQRALNLIQGRLWRSSTRAWSRQGFCHLNALTVAQLVAG